MTDEPDAAGKGAKGGRPPLEPGADGVVRLSGGNPQIAKGDGDEVVRRYIEAMPGWQRQIGREMDEIVTRSLPGVFKCVKWNTAFYGTEAGRWFVGFHCLSRYVKVAFPNGTALKPLPPGSSRQPDVRYYDVHEGKFDPARFADWIRQAARLPGERF